MEEATVETKANCQDDSTVDLDDILPFIGEFGKYQKLLLWLVCLPACIPCGFCAFNQLFMSDTPNHWCIVPALLNYTSLGIEDRLKISVPYDNATNSYSQCLRYAVNWPNISSEDILSLVPDPTWKTETCSDGWEYNTSEVSSSIAIDFDLVCDQAIYPTLGLVSLNIGGPLGVYMFGFLNDKIGRKKTFFICLTTLILGSVSTACARNFWIWALARLIVGLTIPAIYQIPFIISLELVGPNFRSFVTVMTCTFYTMGLILLAGVAYLIRDWRYLSLVTSMPFILYYFYWFFLPESPRWLLSKGRLNEASKILESLARVNGKTLPDSFTHRLQQSLVESFEEKKPQKSVGPSSLCKTPNMRLKTCLITLNWFASQTVYVGLSYYGPALGNNAYMSFFLSSIVEIPSYVTCWLIIDRWGRRWPLCLSMILSGIVCIFTVTQPEDAVTSTLVLYLLSKYFISASFLIIYPFSGELYPTELRGVGIGTSAYIGGLGLIIIPFVNYLGSENLFLPLVIMGVISVLGGLTTLRLPETLHHKLPQTVEEGEEFGKNWSYADCFRCVPLRPVAPSDSYEDLDQLELSQMRIMDLQESNEALHRRSSKKRLMQQGSVMDTQRDTDGTMKMTYWF